MSALGEGTLSWPQAASAGSGCWDMGASAVKREKCPSTVQKGSSRGIAAGRSAPDFHLHESDLWGDEIKERKDDWDHPLWPWLVYGPKENREKEAEDEHQALLLPQGKSLWGAGQDFCYLRWQILQHKGSSSYTEELLVLFSPFLWGCWSLS